MQDNFSEQEVRREEAIYKQGIVVALIIALNGLKSREGFEQVVLSRLLPHGLESNGSKAFAIAKSDKVIVVRCIRLDNAGSGDVNDDDYEPPSLFECKIRVIILHSTITLREAAPHTSLPSKFPNSAARRARR